MYGPPNTNAGDRRAPSVPPEMGMISPPTPPDFDFSVPPPGVPMPPTPHATDYFSGDHHGRMREHGHKHGHGHGHGHGHRREPAAMNASNESFGNVGGSGFGGRVIDPNAFYDPASDPSLEDDRDEFGRDRAPTPRASAGPYMFDDHRAGVGGSGSVHGSERGSLGRRSGTPGPGSGPGAGGGFVPPRPPSRSAVGFDEFGPGSGPGPAFDSPRRGSIPSTSGSGKKGRSRKTSASRTAFGNTPYVRSNGLYED